MAEAQLDLDITPALDAISTLSDAFDSIATDFALNITDAIGNLDATDLSNAFAGIGTDLASSLDGVVTDAITPQIEDITAQFADLGTTAGTSLADALSGGGDLSGASSDLTDLSSGLDELQTSGANAQEGFNLATTGAQGLQAATGLLEGSSSGLIATIAPQAGIFAGISAAVGGLVETADKAELSLKRMKDVFGDSAPKVFDEQLQGLNLSLGELNTQAGGSNTGLRLAIATFGQTAVSAGATKDEAAAVAQRMGELSAVVTTLNPALGTADQNFQLISRGLGGSTRVLQRYGITIDAATQAQLALQIAQEHGRDKANLYDKQVAGSTLALQALNDQAAASGTTLQKELNTSLDTSTIKFRAMKTEISTALVQIGEPLIQPTLTIAKELTPVLIDLIGTAGKLAAALLPAFVPIAHALAEVAGPIKDLGDAFSSMDPSITTAIALFAAMHVAAGPLGRVIDGVSGALQRVGTFGAASVADAPQGFITLGTEAEKSGNKITKLSGFLEENKGKLLGAATTGLIAASSFSEIGKSAEGTAIGIGSLVATGAQLGATIGPEGAVIGGFAGAIVGLSQVIGDSGPDVAAYRQEFEKLGTTLQGLSDKQILQKFMKDLGFNDLLGLASGNIAKITDEFRALASVNPAGGQRLLDQIKEMQTTAGKPLFNTKDIEKLTQVLDAGAKKYKEHSDNAKTDAATNQAVASGANISAGAISNNATALNAQAKAAQEAATAIQGLASTVVSALPSVDSVFQTTTQYVAGFGQALDPASLLAGFQATITDTMNFGTNLSVLVKAGFGQLAQFVADQGPKAGGQILQQIVDGINSGSTDVAKSLNDAILQQGGTIQAINQAFQGPVGTAIYNGTQTAFSTIVPAAANAMNLTAIGIASDGDKLRAAVAYAYQQTQDPINTAVQNWIHTADQGGKGVIAAVNNNAPGVASAATSASTGATSAFQTGLNPLAPAAGAAVTNAGGAITGAANDLSSQNGQAMLAGLSVGQAFDEGMALGINVFVYEPILAAMNAVAAAERGARTAARASSPSRLFAELGKDLALGVAVGLELGTPAVVAGSAAMINNAAQLTSGIGGTALGSGGSSSVVSSSQVSHDDHSVHLDVDARGVPDPVRVANTVIRKIRSDQFLRS